MNNRENENLLIDLARRQQSSYFGKYRGIVREIEDDGNLARIKAEVPQIYGADQLSPWALPCVPFAGPDHGFIFMPEEGDGVWIEFEMGDISKPIWTGSWWANDEIPDGSGKQKFAIISPGGHKINLDDENSKLQLLHSGGAEFTMTDNEITIKIGSTKIVLSSSGVNINDGAFEVK